MSAPAPSGGPTTVRGRLPGPADTPTRLRLLAGVLVVVAVLAGLLAAQASWSASASLGRAADAADQLTRVQGVQNGLLQADADATNAFLIGGLEPPEQRVRYETAMGDAAQGVAQAARAQPADAEVLAALNATVMTYTGAVERARATNRQGLPVGAQYLRVASGDLRADAIPLLQALQEAGQSRAEAELDSARTAWLPAAAAVLVSLLVSVVASVWLARRTRRVLNLPVVVGGGVLLAVLVAATVALVVAAGTAERVWAGSYAAERALSDARVAAFDAKSNESLTLVSRGSGAAFEEAWQVSATTVGDRLDAAAPLVADGADLVAGWQDYTARHEEVRALDDGGGWEAAVDLATTTEAEGTNAAFTAFDVASAGVLTSVGAETRTALDGARGSLVLLGGLCLGAGVVAAVLGWRGVARRLEEYR